MSEQRPDYVSVGDPVHSAPHANAALDIVRELAERGPLQDSDFNCATCGFDPPAMGMMEYPNYHEPSCLWRRARELSPRE